jgi:hypothetical protein
VHTIAYRSTDAVGNVEAVHTATVRIDTRAPATTDDAPNGWRNAPVTVTLTAADGAGSGVAATEYKLDGAAAWNTGTSVAVAAPADHSNDGMHAITYRSTDAVGNVEAVQTATVRIDTRAPATTDDAPAGWHNAPVTISLAPVDAGGAGVATTEYKLDGAAAWSPGTSVTVAAPADHSNDGTHTIAYRSTDTAGNVEAERTATVRIDTQQPATTDDAPAGPRNTPVTVTLTPVDAGGAGIATTEYKLDEATAWSTGTSITIAAPADHSNDGSHTIAYRSTDAAGNAEAPRSATIVIDTTAPTAPTAVVVTSTSETSVTLGWAPSTDAVGVTGYGTYNGLTPATQATDTSGTIAGLDCGTPYTVGVDATDAAGNRSARTDIPVTTACAPGNLSISPTGSDYVWSHLAATYDGTTVRLYVNGVQVSSEAASGAMTASTDPLRIGAGEGGDEWFDGLIDNVRIYSRALTQAEIAANMLVPVTTVTTALAPGLVAAYSFDDGAGTTAMDVSGHGHTGTLDGATWSATGEFGGALDFDGNSDVVSVPDDNALDLTNGMTLEAWVHPSSLQPIWRNVIMKPQGPHLAYALYANAQPQAADQVPAPSAHVYVNGQEYIARAGSSLPPNRCTTEPCATFGHAYRMAASGNVVDVAGGSYPEQYLMFDATKTSPDDVVFRPAQGALVTVDDFDLGTDRNTGGASHVTLRNMTVDGNISIPGCGVPDGTPCPADDVSPGNDLTFKNLRVKGTTAFYCASCSNVSIIGGTWGPDTYACRPGSGSAHPEISSAQGQVKRAHGILIDGVTWQNFARCDAAVDHTECLQVEPADDLTIRNSVFRMCDTIGVNLANDLANSNSAAGYRAPNNVLIENNVFDKARDFTGGDTFYALNIRECTNCTVRYNSWIQAPRMPNGEVALNVKFVGNVGPFGQGTCLPTVTFAYNVWEGAKCSATDKNVAAVGFADPAALDLALVTGSPALGAGDPSDFPPLDARGKPRPAVPDAGAFQH